MNPMYQKLDLPAVEKKALKRGLPVQTRYFYGHSVAGSQAKVVRVMETARGVFVRCNFGKNLGGENLINTLPLDALALA